MPNFDPKLPMPKPKPNPDPKHNPKTKTKPEFDTVGLCLSPRLTVASVVPTPRSLNKGVISRIPKPFAENFYFYPSNSCPNPSVHCQPEFDPRIEAHKLS